MTPCRPGRLDSFMQRAQDAVMTRRTPWREGKAINSGTRASLAALLAVALLAGCAASRPDYGGDPSEERVFSVALKNLKSRYIEKIDLGNTMIQGLVQLASIDDRFAVFRANGAVKVMFDSAVIAEYPAPGPDNVEEWASLGAAVLRDARAASDHVVVENKDGVYKAVFKGVIQGLDRYSRYLSPDEANRNRASRDGYGGIGITVESSDGDYIVRQVLTGTPAEKAGLKSRDVITGIDGKPVHGLPFNELLKKLRGDIGDTVRLTLLRPGEKGEIDRTVVRDHIVPPSVTTRMQDGVLEIKVSIFNQGTVGAVRRAVVDAVRDQGSKLTGIVLDLRNNPGGLLDQAIGVADLFLEQGRIVSTIGRHPRSNQIFDATPGKVLSDLPMAVLINGRSASAAEIVGVALRDSGRAAMIGSTSFGKGTVQTIVRLPNKGEMNITWARIMAPTGQTLASQGIVPAVCTNLSPDDLAALRRILSDRTNYGDMKVAPGFAIQARLSHFSSARREACPPSGARQNHDVDIARLLLSNPPAYAVAVAHPDSGAVDR